MEASRHLNWTQNRCYFHCGGEAPSRRCSCFQQLQPERAVKEIGCGGHWMKRHGKSMPKRLLLITFVSKFQSALLSASTSCMFREVDYIFSMLQFKKSFCHVCGQEEAPLGKTTTTFQFRIVGMVWTPPDRAGRFF